MSQRSFTRIAQTTRCLACWQHQQSNASLSVSLHLVWHWRIALHECFSAVYWADMYRELLGGRTDGQQAASPLKAAGASQVSSTALAAKEESAKAQPAQDSSGKQHDVNPATGPLQTSSDTIPTQPQAASEPTALATLAASQTASKHQNISGSPAGVIDSPAMRKAAGPKGSKIKEQSAKCVFCSDIISLIIADFYQQR